MRLEQALFELLFCAFLRLPYLGEVLLFKHSNESSCMRSHPILMQFRHSFIYRSISNNISTRYITQINLLNFPSKAGATTLSR